MLGDFLLNELIRNFEFDVTNDQYTALQKFSSFLLSPDAQVFILNGYAGTGKTTFIKAVTKTLSAFRYQYVLLAPTGRSAKVLADYCGSVAYTIHKYIYKQKSATDFRFVLNYQFPKNTIFFIDEASLISNDFSDSSIFGSGRLLEDLLEFVFTQSSNKLIFIGDSAQLPPVGSIKHPALDVETFRSLKLETDYSVLTEVVRQQGQSNILVNATKFRLNIENNLVKFPDLEQDNRDFVILDSADVLESIASSYYSVGMDETIILTYSNKRALQINKTIRNQLLGYESELVVGEWLMIVKNNYMPLPYEIPMNFLANGEIITIKKLLKQIERYDFRFTKAIIQLNSMNTVELDVLLLMDTLYSEQPSLSKEQQDKLFYTIMEDYWDEKNKRKRIIKVRENEFFNALQVKYAYAVTAHKSQGGQWKHVYIDASFLNYTELSVEVLKWFYTAITRATEKVFILHLPIQFQS